MNSCIDNNVLPALTSRFLALPEDEEQKEDLQLFLPTDLLEETPTKNETTNTNTNTATNTATERATATGISISARRATMVVSPCQSSSKNVAMWSSFDARMLVPPPPPLLPPTTPIRSDLFNVDVNVNVNVDANGTTANAVVATTTATANNSVNLFCSFSPSPTSGDASNNLWHFENRSPMPSLPTIDALYDGGGGASNAAVAIAIGTPTPTWVSPDAKRSSGAATTTIPANTNTNTNTNTIGNNTPNWNTNGRDNAAMPPGLLLMPDYRHRHEHPTPQEQHQQQQYRRHQQQQQQHRHHHHENRPPTIIRWRKSSICSTVTMCSSMGDCIGGSNCGNSSCILDVAASNDLEDEVSLLADDPEEDDDDVLPHATYDVLANLFDDI
eukprot:CAMPEP_0168182278 /NCGR_PEP_ID=MMETSP0139_2-20121125/11784_1 /TAXON_ID=44445 /ORGANISM="Pseudo-nitzschia australis, Strain 10249 10 AB" /LENGTH=384 /DNA_ID=CAMNT_0008103149 /DNA_START=477 /DNA_END=1631 /DNA_ORIENTATION=+